MGSLDEIHVWVVDHRIDSSELAACLEVLDPAERLRASRFRFDRDHRRFVVGHAFLRLILSYYACMDPKGLRIERRCAVCGADDHGKPYLEPTGGVASEVRFSLSYSDRLVVAAVARGSDVGVDVERIDGGIGWREIAQYAFTPEELGSLTALDDDAAVHAFYRTWTRKEAVSKVSGQGLSQLAEMDSYAWTLGLPDGVFEVSPADPQRSWAGKELDLPDSHLAAVAVEGRASDFSWVVRSIPAHSGEAPAAGLAGSDLEALFAEQCSDTDPVRAHTG